MSISPKRAGESVDALRRGTVPRSSLDAFCVGLDRFETAIDADLDAVKDPAILSKHPGLLRDKGHIGFLGHGSPLAFRKIRIKELP